MKPPALLFLDCETSGLWRDSLAMSDPQQPWCISLAFALCDSDGEMQNFGRYLVKPEGRTIQPGAERVHGVSPRMASQLGIPEARVLGTLCDLLKTMPFETYIEVISYGDLDRRIIGSLLQRFALSQNPPKPAHTYDKLWLTRHLVEFRNLMNPWCTNACRIPSKEVPGSLKWPSLDEAAQIILGREPRGPKHDAWQDMLLLRDLYMELARRGYFNEGVAA